MNLESREFSGADYRDTASTDSKDLTKVLIGALAGAAVGTLIAGSFTQKGVEIRNRVGEGSKNIANNLKDKVSDMKEAITDKYEAAKEGAADLIEKGKQKVGISSGNTGYDSNSAYAGNTAYTSYAEEDDETGTGSKILLGALIVSVAGTIVWSFATEKGNQTRRRIAKKSKNMASDIKEKVSDAAGSIKEKVSDVASSIADTASDVYDSAKEGAADLLEQQKQKLNTPSGNTSYRSSTGADNW